MADLKGLPADLQGVVERAISQIDNASALIEAGLLTPDEWQREMAAIIDRFHQEAAEVGAAGADIDDLTSTINRLVAIQLAFLANFADDIRGTDWLAGYVARAQMYGSAIKQAYWHGDVIRQVGRVLPLPAMPAEGTQCLCITTPESRVFTEFGYVPIGDVKPGTLVLTHKLRWRRVLRSVVSLSTTQYQMMFRAQSGDIIGCTDDHRWLSPGNGWLEAKTIAQTRLYKVPDQVLQKLRFSESTCIELSESWASRLPILFSSQLPPGMPLYDIEIEEDHSFIIEGMISHNSNCKCSWRVDEIDAANGDFDAFWERNVQDSCQTCLEREAQWSPVQIRGGELVVETMKFVKVTMLTFDGDRLLEWDNSNM